MRARQSSLVLGPEIANQVIALWVGLEISVLKVVVFVLLASLLLAYTIHAGQHARSSEDPVPVRSAVYSPIELSIGQPIFITAGDVDGDGHVDLVLLSLCVLSQGHALQTCVYIVKVDWTTGVAYASLLETFEGITPHAAITDLDGDGYTDVVVIDNGARALVVFRGDGHGSFKKDLVVMDQHGFVGSFGVADLDGDSYTDLVLGDILLCYLHILWGPGRLASSESSSYAFPAGHHPASVVTGDFTGDGRPEVAVLGLRADEMGWVHFVVLFAVGEARQLSLLSITDVGDADPNFSSVPLTVGDYDRDGHLDLLTARSEHGFVLLGRGDGTFVVKEVYWLLGENHVSQMILADLDGDGCLNDIIIGQGSARVWVVTGCYGDERVGWVIPVIGLPVSAATADVDRDGTPDLIVASNSLHGSTYLEVFLGNQGGK